MNKRPLKIVLANPRGFCAGVERAIEIVEKALQKYGPPVYVRHEIVHNRYVVQALEAKGAVFVEELTETPDGVPIIFSAHGVPKEVPAEARARDLFYLDATCPLVSKVHREAERHHREGRQLILIGHAGHPEVIGTMGQLPAGTIALIQSAEDAAAIKVNDPERIAYITQTTLSIDDTCEMIDILRRRFPKIRGPKQEDICYATTNRQQAVKAIAAECEVILVVGAPNSSNSARLVEVALKAGCRQAMLVQCSADVEWANLEGVGRLGLTAGASAPEILVEEVIDACRERFDVTIKEVTVKTEDVQFKLPRELRPAAITAQATRPVPSS